MNNEIKVNCKKLSCLKLLGIEIPADKEVTKVSLFHGSREYLGEGDNSTGWVEHGGCVAVRAEKPNDPKDNIEYDICADGSVFFGGPESDLDAENLDELLNLADINDCDMDTIERLADACFKDRPTVTVGNGSTATTTDMCR